MYTLNTMLQFLAFVGVASAIGSVLWLAIRKVK